jgi:hypothetical protein
MHFHRAWNALCELLLISGAFTGASAAPVLAEQPFEAKMLTGAALSEALSSAKANPTANLTLPNLNSGGLDKRQDPICDKVFLCALGTVVAGVGVLTPASPPALLADYNSYYATALTSLISQAAAQSQDLAGDIANSFAVAIANNNFALANTLLENGALALYLNIGGSGLYINTIISLAGLNAILPNCGDTTYNALVNTIATLVDVFVSQYAGTGEGSSASPTVLAANINGDNGLVDGISVGASFELAISAIVVSLVCPAFGDVW